MALVLMSTDACHLCELAVVVLQQVSQHRSIEVYSQDIVEDERLVERYGTQIPVLVDDQSQQQLNWPFDCEQVLNWLTKASTINGSLS